MKLLIHHYSKRKKEGGREKREKKNNNKFNYETKTQNTQYENNNSRKGKTKIKI